MDREKIIARIMKECELDGEPVTRAEAEEMADMEIKAKGVTDYAQSDKKEKKPRKKREVKKDERKIQIIEKLFNFCLTNSYDDVTIVNEQREISFKIGTDEYSIVLTKHRTKKEV